MVVVGADTEREMVVDAKVVVDVEMSVAAKLLVMRMSEEVKMSAKKKLSLEEVEKTTEMICVVYVSDEMDTVGEMNVRVVADDVKMEVEWMFSPHLHKKADVAKVEDDVEGVALGDHPRTIQMECMNLAAMVVAVMMLIVMMMMI